MTLVRNRRSRLRWVGAIALAIMAVTGFALYLVTRGTTVKLHGAVRLVAAGSDRSSTGPGACAPANAATPFVGSEVMITNTRSDPRGSFVIGQFEDAHPGCWSLFRGVDIRADDSGYLVRIDALPPAPMTRDQLVAAESPDAYSGIVFLVSGCATDCRTTVKTAIELSAEHPPTTPSGAPAHS